MARYCIWCYLWSATYNLCQILNTQFLFSDDYFSETKTLKLYFKNCILDEVNIDLGNNKSTTKAPFITFENCEIRQLKINDGSINFKMDTLTYTNQKVKIENVRIVNHLEEFKDEKEARIVLSNHINRFIFKDNIECNYETWFGSLF